MTKQAEKVTSIYDALDAEIQKHPRRDRLSELAEARGGPLDVDGRFVGNRLEFFVEDGDDDIVVASYPRD
jgi:hypothetical protein